MAYTITRESIVFGNKAGEILQIVADGAEANIQTRLSRIDAHTIGYGSMATRHITIGRNSNSTGLATQGMLGLSGVASGDEFVIVVYGRP